MVYGSKACVIYVKSYVHLKVIKVTFARDCIYQARVRMCRGRGASKGVPGPKY